MADDVKDLPLGCESLIKDDLSNLCGLPALSSHTSLLLQAQVINKIPNKKTFHAYESSNNRQCQVILANRSDLEVSAACQTILEPFDQCRNAAESLADGDIDGITIRCKPEGSRAKEHPPCHHEAEISDTLEKVNVRRMYRCAVCGLVCSTMSNLLLHQRNVHHGIHEEKSENASTDMNNNDNKNNFKLLKSNCHSCRCSHIIGKYHCDNCTFYTTCPSMLEGHINAVHDTKQVYRCPVCDHQHPFYIAMEKHLFEMHKMDEDDKGEIMDEKKDGRKIPKALTDASLHRNTTKEVVVVDANTRTSSSGNLARTVKEPRLCAFCAARFNNDTAFASHIKRLHLCRYDPTFLCCICLDFRTDNLNMLTDHVKSSHIRIFPSFMASMFFPDSDDKDKIAEELVERARQPFVYAMDSMTMPMMDLPYYHVKSRTYNGDGLLLRLNEMSLHDYVSIVCRYCPGKKVCKTRKDMLEHMIDHTHYWPYWCQACVRKFKHELEALKHCLNCRIGIEKRTVGSKISYKCLWYDLRKQNEQVVALMCRCLLGTECQFSNCAVPEFWCNICEFVAIKYNDIVRHMAVHGLEPLYSCTVCRSMKDEPRAVLVSHMKTGKCRGYMRLWGGTFNDQYARDNAAKFTTMVEFIHVPKKNDPKLTGYTFTYADPDPEPEPEPEPQPPRKVARISTPGGEIEKSDEPMDPPSSASTPKSTRRYKKRISSTKYGEKSEMETACPQCEDFEGSLSDVILHYRSMHSDMVACSMCYNSPFYHIVDYYIHVKAVHGKFSVSELGKRRSNPEILARDLMEQLGCIARVECGTRVADKFITCQLITVKLTHTQGTRGAIFVCKCCDNNSSRDVESFFDHIARHLKIVEFHCLHCPFEGGMQAIGTHYHRKHTYCQKPKLLPYNVRYAKLRNLMMRIVDTLDTQNESDWKPPEEKTDSQKPRVKTEPVDGNSPRLKTENSEGTTEDDIWTYSINCSYCRTPVNDIAACNQHILDHHIRKPLSCDIDIEIALPAVDARKVLKTIGSGAQESLRRTIDKRNGDLNPSSCGTSIPEGYSIFEMNSGCFVDRYRNQMRELYNIFSISEVVANITGTDLKCHLCSSSRKTFPALFDHWSRDHVHIEPYMCPQCVFPAKRPAAILTHDRRVHYFDSRKYAINTELEEELFEKLERILKGWLRETKVDSHCPDDWKLVSEPEVRLIDIAVVEKNSIDSVGVMSELDAEIKPEVDDD